MVWWASIRWVGSGWRWCWLWNRGFGASHGVMEYSTVEVTAQRKALSLSDYNDNYYQRSYIHLSTSFFFPPIRKPRHSCAHIYSRKDRR
ncbi:hypothetical protein AOQ84DRAFT_157364 [Glonium stellatum]|uniref:Secreted protein n=1 Tax=Glonium stellatum TaxID=574774 RepID=A0A8E2ER65_9PEZI|nr:hypothetical protein AOQ84DRAFT_157364 [Glonium stellatum]